MNHDTMIFVIQVENGTNTQRESIKSRRKKKKRKTKDRSYNAKNANYSRKFRRIKASAFEIMNQEDKARNRKQKSHEKLAGIRTPPQDPTKVSKPYSGKSSLNREVNNVKKIVTQKPKKEKHCHQEIC